MTSIHLPTSQISAVIDDPSTLAAPMKVGLSPSTASYILQHGYNKGFRSVFILNASLTAVATITSIFMIKHKELTRHDDEKLKNEARQEVKDDSGLDVEAGREKSPPPPTDNTSHQ